MKDIRWDALRGFILWPQHEHNASSHFISATALAKMHDTVNIHALYSEEEIRIEAELAEAGEKAEVLGAWSTVD